MNTNQQISIRIIALVATGVAIDVAFDSVLGQGAYVKFANDLYDTLQK